MSTQKTSGWKSYFYCQIAAEISSLTRYYDRLVQFARRPEDRGLLFAAIDCSQKNDAPDQAALEALGQLDSNGATRSAVLINGNLNHSYDIQGLLESVRAHLSRPSRVVIVAYNPYLRGLLWLATKLGLREGPNATTFLTRSSLGHLAKLSGFEIVRARPVVYSPFRLFGLGTLLNAVMPIVPVIRWLSLSYVAVLRPAASAEKVRPSLTVLVPARNERGNIENAVKRLPDLGAPIELIFVEGHSNDGTWEEIERVRAAYEGKLRPGVTIRSFRQTGKGKADAVRLGFSKATGDLLTILDADLTMPPEKLGLFYEAYVSGIADFVNGSRLLYPMEGEAMRFLNHLGNIFFAKSLSAVLEQPITDSLCGTKLLRRLDYERMKRWRADFGDFDPFGDFELIFPSAILALGSVDVPIRYMARTYGSTNIHRFRHGMILLKMVSIGLLRIRMGRGARPVPSAQAMQVGLETARG